jgi:hypothetical protein
MSSSNVWDPSRLLSKHALRLGRPAPGRFKALRSLRVPVRIWAPERGRSCGPSSARSMLIADTGPLVAYRNRNDRDHERCAALLDSHGAAHPASEM